MASTGAAAYADQVAMALPAGLLPDADADARGSLDNATTAAGQISGNLGAPVLSVARDAFTNELNTRATATAAVIAAAGTILAAALLRPVPPTGSAAPDVKQVQTDVAAARTATR